jgi:hypothetical protein
MPGQVIGTSFNNGYVGQISRMGDSVVRSRAVKSDSANINFGDPFVVNSDGTVSKFGASNTAAQFAGIAARRVKSATVYPNQSLAYYAANELLDGVERGGVCVVCNVGTPTVGGAVYLRIALNGSIPDGVVGGFEAAADSTNTIQLTNVKWGTTKDSNGVAELIILTRQGV